MKKSWLKYLWLLGFLGLLGLFRSNTGFFGFFGFFGFIGLSQITDDERLQTNINKAARNAFVSALLLFCGVMIYAALAPQASIFIYAFSANFALQILVFVVSFRIYERLEG